MHDKTDANSGSPRASDLRREAEQRFRNSNAASGEGMTEEDVRALVQEQQVHQIELEMQNEELLRAQTSKQDVYNKYHDLFEFAPVGYFRLDEHGRILEVNLAGAALLGLDRSTAVRQRFGQFVAMEHRAAFAEFCKRTSATAVSQTCEVGLQRDEQRVDVLLCGTLSQGGGGTPSFDVTATDITERRRMEDVQTFLLQCRYSGATEGFFYTLARYLAQTLQMDYVCIDQLLGDELAAQTLAVYNDGKFDDNATYALKDTPCGEVVGKAICCFPRDVCELFPQDLVLQELRAQSYVGATLWSFDGKPIGLIAIIGRKPLAKPHLVESVLKLVAIRAAGELERKQVEDVIQTTRDKLSAVLESITDAFFSVDNDFRLTYLNREAERIFRKPRQEVLGMNLWELFPDATGLLFKREYERAMAESETAHFEEFYPPFNQWFSVRAYPSSAGLSVYIENITERKHAEAALAKSKETAEAANLAKSQFLANMSHELRTPMNAILGMTDFALQEDLSPRVRDCLQTAKQSADALLELLNEILDLSRIEAGGIKLESVSVDLRQILDQVVHSLGGLAHEKGLELVCDLNDLPNQLVGDPLRLRQVLVNLVSNAVKFTSKGVVMVRATVQSLQPREAVLQFDVADTGIGITPTEQLRIFAPFVQADASTTRNYGGTGLGLTIAAKLVDLMGGRIWVESEPGKGSTFRFTARLGRQEGLEEEPRLLAAIREALYDQPVLVVANNPASGRVLVETFRRWSMKPEMADDVPIAVTKVHQAADNGQSFRIVLADAEMPGVDGFTLAKSLRNDVRSTGPIILMLSASHLCGRDECCRDVGALCLVKPVTQSNLINVLAEALGIQQQAVRTSDVASADISLTPSRSLRVLLAEDTQANQRLATYILSKRGHRIELVQNGQDALEAVRRDQFDAVLMDVQMPLMDGLEATQEIRKLQDPTKSHLPIIAMTAHALKGDRERCLAAGMDGYISKPIKREELIEVLERLVEQTAGDQVNQLPLPMEISPPLQATLPLASARVFDLDEAVKQCFGKYNLFQEMVEFHFCDTGPVLAQMRTALRNGDAAEMGNAAHRLNGTLGALGAASATDAARLVEQMGTCGQLTGAAEAIQQLEEQLAILHRALAPHLPAPNLKECLQERVDR